MVYFDNWEIRPSVNMLNGSFEREARQIRVSGNMPEDLTWICHVRMGKVVERYQMQLVDGAYQIEPSKEFLNYSGWYEFQLTGTDGNMVAKTNIASAYAPQTLAPICE